MNDAERVYQLIKKRAERTVNENIATYKQNIAATIEYELIMMKRAVENDDDSAARHHKIMVEIYQSVLERI